MSMPGDGRDDCERRRGRRARCLQASVPRLRGPTAGSGRAQGLQHSPLALALSRRKATKAPFSIARSGLSSVQGMRNDVCLARSFLVVASRDCWTAGQRRWIQMTASQTPHPPCSTSVQDLRQRLLRGGLVVGGLRLRLVHLGAEPRNPSIISANVSRLLFTSLLSCSHSGAPTASQRHGAQGQAGREGNGAQALKRRTHHCLWEAPAGDLQPLSPEPNVPERSTGPGRTHASITPIGGALPIPHAAKYYQRLKPPLQAASKHGSGNGSRSRGNRHGAEHKKESRASERGIQERPLNAPYPRSIPAEAFREVERERRHSLEFRRPGWVLGASRRVLD